MATTFNSVDLGYCNSSGVQGLQYRFDVRTYTGVNGASFLKLGKRPKEFTVEGFFVPADGAALKSKQESLEGASYTNILCTGADFGKPAGIDGAESGVILPYILTFKQTA